jgi:uncharacterized protein (DUF1501 family)
MVGALKTGLGPLWADTLVVVATEFGRTVKVNGTQGTDHGTGSVAMLMGGAVNGGRVVADWPGLATPRSTKAATCAHRRARHGDRQRRRRHFDLDGQQRDRGDVPGDAERG